MRDITFVTGNANKADQLSRWLEMPLLQRSADLHEIQTVDLEELIRHKALEAYRVIGSAVLVDDTALRFHVLGGLPGPFIKFFLSEIGLVKCCNLLASFEDRGATASVLYGLTVDGHEVEIFRGDTEGMISPAPSGDGGYGWDSIFIPEGQPKTFAEMTEEELRPFNPRARAIEQLKRYLQQR